MPGPAFSHLLLLVKAEQSVIADVGFGDSFLLPLIPGEHFCYQLDRFYQLLDDDGLWTMQQQFDNVDWESRFVFEMQPYQLEHFDAMCIYHQTSESSRFTHSTVCSRATEQGRVTYTNRRLILNNGIDRQETVVENRTSLREIFESHFNFYFSDNELERLIAAIQIQRSFEQ